MKTYKSVIVRQFMPEHGLDFFPGMVFTYNPKTDRMEARNPLGEPMYYDREKYPDLSNDMIKYHSEYFKFVENTSHSDGIQNG